MENRSGGKNAPAPGGLPGWLPRATLNYIGHIERGQSIRQLARHAGCHPSTVLRQVRRIEQRRDDPLFDEALSAIGAQLRRAMPPDAAANGECTDSKDDTGMTRHASEEAQAGAPGEELIASEGRRILRRLSEPGACLAVARDMEKAVVVREASDGRAVRTAVVDRQVAQAMALREWIASADQGRVARYRITSVGRAALKRLLAEAETARAGFQEDAASFRAQHGDFSPRAIDDPHSGARRRVRYNHAESPVAALARRKDKSGRPFLSPDLVAAAERLREDFELAQMGPRVAQDWERFLTGGDRGSFMPDSGTGNGPAAARARVNAALRDLGPGLGDVALRVCCFLEGLEAAEKRMGWAARSGKVVLRIALQRLRRHYDSLGGNNLIG